MVPKSVKVKIENTATCLVVGITERNEHISPLLKDLIDCHLTTELFIKILVIVFAILHGATHEPLHAVPRTLFFYSIPSGYMQNAINMVLYVHL